MNLQKRHVRAELYIAGNLAKTFFGLLNNQKAEIEGELSYPLEWEELPDARDCRIACYLNEVGLAKRLNEMHRVFAPRVRVLEAGQ